MAVVNVEESEGFREIFLEPALDPSWQVVSGLGSYSLTDRPGYLRYYLKGSRAYSGGWRKDYKVETWRPSLTLLRPFEGSNWILKTKATYNIHACADVNVPVKGSTGAQYQDLYIAFGEGVNDFLVIDRGTDWWYGTNRMVARLISNGVEIASCTLLAPDDVIKQKDNEGWFVYTYWYEVARNGQEITFRYSYDGKNYVEGFSASLTKPVEVTQKAIIDANVWTTAGSYVDWDYFNVESSPLANLPIITIEGIGDIYTEKLKGQGVEIIRDLATTDIPALSKKVDISIFKLYVADRRAELALSVKVDGEIFEPLLEMRLEEIMMSPVEKLSTLTDQPTYIIHNLKMSVSTLLLALDNEIVKNMLLGDLVVGPYLKLVSYELMERQFETDEKASVNLTVKNMGSTTAQNVKGAVTSDFEKLKVLSGDINFGDISKGSVVSAKVDLQTLGIEPGKYTLKLELDAKGVQSVIQNFEVNVVED